MTRRVRRREILRLLGAAPPALMLPGCSMPRTVGAVADNEWRRGDVVHLLPTASHERLLVKASFALPRDDTPRLSVDGGSVDGTMTDTRGRYWAFDVDGLEPQATSRLQIVAPGGRPLCDPWPLATLPHPDRDIDRLRMLLYTCAGGDEELAEPDGTPLYLGIDDRRRLLRRGLELRPDVVVANGDHIYYDQRSMLARKPPGVIAAHRALFDRFGMLDRDLPVLGSANEDVIAGVGERQIAALYGTDFRSTPMFMLSDDHDLFENDEANEDFIALPPEPMFLEAARAVQRMFLPEFLPAATRPADLPGGGAAGKSEVFGTLRFGSLFEALLYDTKRFTTIDGDDAVMLPRAAEAWLASRTAAGDTRQLVHMPSTPVGWTAGKWGEWYPDVLQPDGALGTSVGKPYWPRGWWLQHQRLLAMIAAQRERHPVLMSGDLHMFAAGRVTGSGELDFADNPILSVVVGPVGTGTPAFPSTARNILPQVPADMRMAPVRSPLEKNGFSIVDVGPGAIGVQFYAWRPPESAAAIDSLQPAFELTI